MERSMRYNEPPSYPRPVLQALGEKALADGKLQVAEAAFREALDQYPESSRALSGLSDTLKREGSRLAPDIDPDRYHRRRTGWVCRGNHCVRVGLPGPAI